MNEGEPYYSYIHDILLGPPFHSFWSLVKLSILTVHTRYTVRMRGTVNWWASESWSLTESRSQACYTGR